MYLDPIFLSRWETVGEESFVTSVCLPPTPEVSVPRSSGKKNTRVFSEHQSYLALFRNQDFVHRGALPLWRRSLGSLLVLRIPRQDYTFTCIFRQECPKNGTPMWCLTLPESFSVTCHPPREAERHLLCHAEDSLSYMAPQPKHKLLLHVMVTQKEWCR